MIINVRYSKLKGIIVADIEMKLKHIKEINGLGIIGKMKRKLIETFPQRKEN